jgi:hypothetical protein
MNVMYLKLESELNCFPYFAIDPEDFCPSSPNVLLYYYAGEFFRH